jgi:hypothetical protein
MSPTKITLHTTRANLVRHRIAQAAAITVLAATVAVAVPGVGGARPNDPLCSQARRQLAHNQTQLNIAHDRKDQESVQYWRGAVFDAQLEVLSTC